MMTFLAVGAVAYNESGASLGGSTLAVGGGSIIGSEFSGWIYDFFSGK